MLFDQIMINNVPLDIISFLLSKSLHVSICNLFDHKASYLCIELLYTHPCGFKTSILIS